VENSKEFKELRDSSIGQQLVRAARVYSDFLFRQIKDHLDAPGFRPSHFQLFAHIPLEGTTTVELANKLGVSKQSMSVLINEMLEMDILLKCENPNDKRSFLIKFQMSEDGPLKSGMRLIKSFDQELADLLGKKLSHQLESKLTTVIDHYS
jgi:DNA-binding MarR family transcriptional regulator